MTERDRKRKCVGDKVTGKKRNGNAWKKRMQDNVKVEYIFK